MPDDAKPRDLAVEYRPLDSLVGYLRNARTHSDEQVAEIAGSIREFGWTNPILVDGDNGVIAGHGRLLAARKLGLTDAPVIELAHRGGSVCLDRILRKLSGSICQFPSCFADHGHQVGRRRPTEVRPMIGGQSYAATNWGGLSK